MNNRSTSQLVGRQWELAILHRSLAKAAEGRVQVVAISGDPGIGKTALLESMARFCEDEGLVVLEGGASDAEGMPPYLPFLEALGTYIRSADAADLAAQVGTRASILSTLLPELETRLPSVEALYAIPQNQGKLRLYEAIGHFLGALAEKSALLLVLDDLHWSDPSTLELLVYIARRYPAARMLVLAGFRSAEGEVNAALSRALTDLARCRVLTRLALGPLTRLELADIVRARLPEGADETVLETLYTQSEGNPFFADELLLGWSEASSVVLRDQLWCFEAGTPKGLPASILSAVRERLAKLPDDTVSILTTAALIGRSFRPEILAQSVGETTEEVEKWLSPAMSAGLLFFQNGEWSFTHDTVRETAAADILPMRRLRFHNAIGDALETMPLVAGKCPTSELAFHYCAGNNKVKGVLYALRAAQEAEDRSAFTESLMLYSDALHLMDAEDARRLDVMLRCGQMALNLDGGRDAEKYFSTAFELAQRGEDSRALGRAAHGRALSHWHLGNLNAAAIDLQLAVSVLSDCSLPDAVHSLVDLAGLHSALGNQSEGLEAASRALKLATDGENARLEASACRAVGQLTAWGNDLEGGELLLRKALSLATSVDDPVGAAETCGILANICFARLDPSESKRLTLLRSEFAQRSQQPHELRHVKAWLAELSVQRGNWEEASILIDEAQETIGLLQSDEPRAVLGRVRGRMAQYQERLDDAARWYEESLARIRPLGAQHLAWYLGALACVELLRGNEEKSRGLMLQLEEVLTSISPGSLSTAPALTDLVEWAILAEDGARASRYVVPLRKFEGRMFLSLVDLTLGRYELSVGNTLGARKYLDRAENDVRRAGLRTQLLLVLGEKSRAEGIYDGSTRAVAREEIGSLRRDLHLPPLENHAHPSVEGGKDSKNTARLSNREIEVLRLVSSGHSNRAIAAELFVTQKTVERHISNIFFKTGTSNRAGATAYAIHHDLV